MRKRADSRALVQEHIARINREAEASMTVRTQPAEVEENTRYEFRPASLHEICAHVGREDRETTLERLKAYLFDVFPLPPESEHKHQRRRVAEMTTLSRRKLGRVDYGRAQNLWGRNPRRYYDQFMEGTGVTSGLPKIIMVPFWEALMTDARNVCPPEPQQEPKISALWDPIMLPEVREALPECNTAPGPDGLSARILRKMPREFTTFYCGVGDCPYTSV